MSPRRPSSRILRIAGVALLYVMLLWWLRGGVVIGPPGQALPYAPGTFVSGWASEPYLALAPSSRTLIVFPLWTLLRLAIMGTGVALLAVSQRHGLSARPMDEGACQAAATGAGRAGIMAGLAASAFSCCFPLPWLTSALAPVLLPLMGAAGGMVALTAWADGIATGLVAAALWPGHGRGAGTSRVRGWATAATGAATLAWVARQLPGWGVDSVLADRIAQSFGLWFAGTGGTLWAAALYDGLWLRRRGGSLTTRLRIDDVTCPRCIERLQAALRQVDGVARVTFETISYADAAAVVTIRHAQTCPPERLIRAVEEAAVGTRHRYAARPLP